MVFPMVPAGGSNDNILLNEKDLENLWQKEFYQF
jgi:hypothetical protein